MRTCLYRIRNWLLSTATDANNSWQILSRSDQNCGMKTSEFHPVHDTLSECSRSRNDFTRNSNKLHKAWYDRSCLFTILQLTLKENRILPPRRTWTWAWSHWSFVSVGLHLKYMGCFAHNADCREAAIFTTWDYKYLLKGCLEFPIFDYPVYNIIGCRKVLLKWHMHLVIMDGAWCCRQFWMMHCHKHRGTWWSNRCTQADAIEIVLGNGSLSSLILRHCNVGDDLC